VRHIRQVPDLFREQCRIFTGATNIRRMTDVRRHPDVEDVRVLIQIWFEEKNPPRGEAASERADPVQFVGWLGLLRVLSDLLAPPKR
jgi:hypothetical protein